MSAEKRGARKGQKGHQYTEAQLTFLRLECELPRKELTLAFNQRFGTDLSESAIKGTCKRNGWKSGRDGRFQKGHVPSPKAINSKPNRTSFKKGNRPHNWKPVGSERWSGGYLQRKLTDTGYPPRDWVCVHHIVWREHHGEIPKGHKVLFRDSDPSNCYDVTNLMLVSDAELAVLNKARACGLAPELMDTALLLAKLKMRQREIGLAQTG